MGILQRYVLKELLRVFLLALVAFTAIFVIGGLVHEASRQGLGPAHILLMIPFVIPASLPFTIPATLLLAVSVVYGRLAADNEIVATKAAGINVLYYLVFPALLLAVALSCLTLFLYDRVIPFGNLRMRKTLVSNVEDMVYGVLKRESALKGPSLPYEIYAQGVNGRKLLNATFKRKDSAGGYDLIVFAQEATLDFDLTEKVVNVHMLKAEVTDGRGMRIETNRDKVFQVPLPNVDSLTPGIRDLTLNQVENRKAEVLRRKEMLCARWAFSAIAPLTRGRLQEVPWHEMDGVAKQTMDAQRDLWRLGMEPHMRRAISFGCIGFVLLGCPIAILFQRGDYLSAFISCFLPIILLYYPMVMLGYNMSKEGLTSPLILWAGNALLVVLGILAFRPVLRH